MSALRRRNARRRREGNGEEEEHIVWRRTYVGRRSGRTGDNTMESVSVEEWVTEWIGLLLWNVEHQLVSSAVLQLSTPTRRVDHVVKRARCSRALQQAQGHQQAQDTRDLHQLTTSGTAASRCGLCGTAGQTFIECRKHPKLNKVCQRIVH